ncbi:MAG TPA: Ig-like domain-containing protein [Gemmatimonadales bacterium]|nr:Ig-like domain-containing protein [Gemmatimonadales bacterium]
MTSLRFEADRSARRRAPRLALGIATCLALASSVATPAASQTATEVQVTPETMTLGVGQRQPIFATAYDRQGNLIPSAKFTFWSSDTSVARVGRDGNVVGVAPGLAKVEARVQGKRASLAVLITGGATGQGGGVVLTLEPATAMLLPGERVQVIPAALHEDGSQVTVGRVTWKSLKPEVADVDTAGLVAAVAAGKSIVQATTATGLMATVPVEVEPAEIAITGATQVLGPEEAETLRVEVPSQGGRVISAAAEWRSADTSVAIVGPTGIVQALRPGRTEIAVLALGQERRTTLVVHRLPQTLVVSPKPAPEALQIPLRATRTFTAAALAADSTPVPEARVTWEVTDTGVAAFDRATGTLIARDTGATTLTARLRGFEPVVWHLRIVPGVLGLERQRVGLRPGEQLKLAAVLRDDEGKALGPAAVEWSSDNAGIAAVSGGEVRAVSPGHATVSATSAWGSTVAADVFVTADLLVASNRGGQFGLYQVRPESPDTLLPLLVDGAGNVQPARSPDRTRVAFSSARGGGYDLYVMSADGKDVRKVTSDPGSEGEPAWTPDGTRIVYSASVQGGVPQLVSMRSDGSDARPLTSSQGGNRSPDVSPDGRRVAFVSARDGNPEIYEVGIDGGEARRLTKTGDKEASPRYLPNGDLIFIVDKGSKARVMRLPAGAASATMVLEIDQPVVALDVSPDGGRLAYVAGKLSEAGKGKSQLTLRLQPLSAGSKPMLVPLRPGEQVLSPSF